MKSCPKCNCELSEKAPKTCAACGFEFVLPDSPTLRNTHTTRVPSDDLPEPSAPTLTDEHASGSDLTIKQVPQDDDLDVAPTLKVGHKLPPVASTDQTLLIDPMQTMSRPLDDKLDNAAAPLPATIKPPNVVGPQSKTIIGQHEPTVVNPQAALDAAEAYSQGLQSLIPPRTIVRKEEVADQSDYQIQKRIGSGAYGVVFQAKQVPLERSVAIKLLQTSDGHEDRQQTIKNEFLREAQFTGRLEHPNIVPIHDIGLTVSPKGAVNPFYVMKEIRGQSWLQTIRKNSLKDNLEIFKNVVNAIGFAHAQNILHCDLKPENVMLGEFGEVLVVDWGQAVDLSSPKTIRPGGTPAYISPEMAQYWIDIYLNHKKTSQSQSDVGHRSDVYLLGALLFETLTGFPPHCKTSSEPPYEIIEKAAENYIVEYESDVDVDQDLMHIALRTLRATDENHIETTADLLTILDQYETRLLSMQLRRRADELLETAVAEADYDAFQRSRFSYEEAIEKWDGNALARDGLRNAKLRCAQQALDDQNFDLGLDVLENTDGDDETALRELLTDGKRTRDRRKRLVARLAVALAGSILLGILINGYMINENLKSVKARDLAIEEKAQIDIARKKLEVDIVQLKDGIQDIADEKQQLSDSIEPMRQKQVKMRAEIAAFPAKLDAQDKEFQQLKREQKAKFEAQEAQLILEQKEEKEKLQADIDTLDEQRKTLDQQKETLAAEKQSLEGQVVNLNESSKLLRYKSGLTQIVNNLQSGDYFNARKNLDKYQNQNDWEVARLNLLAHREIKSFYPTEPINAIAATTDGQTFAVAFPDRIEIKPFDQLDQPGKKIERQDASAIALSPDGNQLYVAKPSDSPSSAGQIEVFDLTQPNREGPVLTLPAQSISIDQIEASNTGNALLTTGKTSLQRQSSGQGLEEPLMVWGDGQRIDVKLVLPNGAKPKFDSASFSRDGQRILLTNRSGLPPDQAAYVFERSDEGYQWVATSPIQGISAATFDNNSSNEIVISLQNANSGNYILARWRYTKSTPTASDKRRPNSGSLTNISPLASKTIQLRQHGNFVIATESNRQTTVWDWRNKKSIELKGQSRPANLCFIKPGERLEDCQVITAATGENTELLSVDLSMYQPEYQRQSIGWSLENRPASVTAVFYRPTTDHRLQAFGNDYGMASVIRDDNRAQWNTCAWQYQIASDDFVFAQSVDDYLYQYDRASGALNRVLTKLAAHLNGREKIADLQVSDDGQVALVQTNANQPKFLLWNLKQDQLIREVNYGHQNLFGTGTQKQLPKLALSRDGKWVIGAKVGVFGWPVDSGQLIRFSTTSVARSIANSIVFVRNSQQVLVSWQNRIIQFDLNQQRQTASHSLPQISDAQLRNNVFDAISDAGNIQILAAENNSDGGILLLSLANKTQLAKFANASFASFASTPTGVVVIAGGLDDAKIRLQRWTRASGTPQPVDLPAFNDPALTKHFIGFERVYASSEHGILLQTSQRNRRSANRMWSSLAIETDSLVGTVEPSSFGPLRILAKPSVKQIVTNQTQAATLANGQILFWKLSDTGVKPDGVLDTWATTMKMAADSNTLAISTNDNRCVIYDFSKREKLGEIDLKDNDGDVTSIAWQSDSKAIAIGRSNGSIEVLELNENDFAQSSRFPLKLNTPIEHAISQLAYSQDGALLATITDDGMAVLIRPTGTEAKSIQDPTGKLSETVYGHSDEHTISAAHISADGNRIVSGSKSGRITIWNSQPQPKTREGMRNASSERELLNMPNLHQSPISIVEFVDGPNGKTVFSTEQNSGKNDIIAWPTASPAPESDNALSLE